MWGSDVTSADSPFEAGLGFAVAMGKDDFIGRAALSESGALSRHLACIVLDDPRGVALGVEPVRVAEASEQGLRVEINLFGTWTGGSVAAEPLFDPQNERVRA